jgi:hypothetical protein
MVRWSYRNVAFAAIHHTSSNNGWVKNDLSRQAETAGRVRAMKQVLGELEQTTIQRKREAVVVATQVDPFTEQCKGHYAEICESVRKLARNLPVPVLLVHGDTNAYCLDQPIADAPNLWRLNGVGDWKVIDADLVSFDPTNPRKPLHGSRVADGAGTTQPLQLPQPGAGRQHPLQPPCGTCAPSHSRL